MWHTSTRSCPCGPCNGFIANWAQAQSLLRQKSHCPFSLIHPASLLKLRRVRALPLLGRVPAKSMQSFPAGARSASQLPTATATGQLVCRSGSRISCNSVSRKYWVALPPSLDPYHTFAGPGTSPSACPGQESCTANLLSMNSSVE